MLRKTVKQSLPLTSCGPTWQWLVYNGPVPTRLARQSQPNPSIASNVPHCQRSRGIRPIVSDRDPFFFFLGKGPHFVCGCDILTLSLSGQSQKLLCPQHTQGTCPTHRARARAARSKRSTSRALLHLRCHSRCSASTLEHSQRSALTTVVLCTCDVKVDALHSTHEHIQSSALTKVVLRTREVTVDALPRHLKHTQRSVLTTVVLCTCDVTVKYIQRSALTTKVLCTCEASGTHSTLCVDNSGALQLRGDSEHIQTLCVDTVVLCTCNVPANTCNALR